MKAQDRSVPATVNPLKPVVPNICWILRTLGIFEGQNKVYEATLHSLRVSKVRKIAESLSSVKQPKAVAR